MDAPLTTVEIRMRVAQLLASGYRYRDMTFVRKITDVSPAQYMRLSCYDPDTVKSLCRYVSSNDWQIVEIASKPRRNK